MVKSARVVVTATVLLGVACTVGRVPSARADPAATEYEVKAVYLFNFARFVAWPAAAFTSPSAPFAVCVLGHDPFGPVLARPLANETVDGRPLEARRVATPADATNCQLLFLDARDVGIRPALLRTLDGRPVLTVSDDEAFAENGGMVGLPVVSGTVRVTVNQAALRRAGLTMSSQLLRIARIVPGAP